ncbi:NAD(+) synthase [Deferribacter desulfuricans SSM1]|uniref:NH(3)-dependent NAD(+) synthetase n=1 Tax=Deferribacter desulfuricans (strain DSM 14783 / JCM 11476 / NBRC 101012 / SSM1) TaxID=639282 RepID=D3PBI9_DEFDS|nr:NAD+ synthase [Deferribacter desulfuricans]BAI79962.1 NAD(+) synthase [Deferribacter desulfuricans SSM1]
MGKSELNLDYRLVTKVLTDFIKNETEKVGIKNVVVGLSGGIDSALSATLATLALGKDRVYAYALPYKTSSKESLDDAKLVADFLGVNFEIIEITDFVDPYFDKNPDISKLRKGNVMARMRMIVLFDKSAEVGGLVLGTSNKTELLLGYGTWYGDLASAINPIGDLYKTQVWELAVYLNIPKRVIEKKPTADLWEGQSDEDELGFTYKEVDRLLKAMIDDRKDSVELIRMGFSENFINNIKERIRKNQFKRQLPIIAKISNRTIDKDFRYSRDWGY